MTAATPPLVELGAAALWDRAAPVQKRARPNWAAVKDDPDWYHGVQETRADARAVLDALTKAGGVEVVTGYGVKLRSGDVERTGTNIQDAKERVEDMKGFADPDYEPVEVVTRTTTTITIRTDWTAVER